MPSKKNKDKNKDINDNLSHLSPNATEDYNLVLKALAGNQFAYEAILKKYRVSLKVSVMRIVKNNEVAEDIVLETFGKAFARLNEYNPKFAFSTWLFRIGINRAIDVLRNKKNLNTSSIDEYITEESESTFAQYLTSPTDDPIQNLLKQEKVAFVKLIMEKLTPRYKKVVEMFYYQDMSCDEIAKELNTTSNTIKSELFKARRVLHHIITSMKRENE